MSKTLLYLSDRIQFMVITVKRIFDLRKGSLNTEVVMCADNSKLLNALDMMQNSSHYRVI